LAVSAGGGEGELRRLNTVAVFPTSSSPAHKIQRWSTWRPEEVDVLPACYGEGWLAGTRPRPSPIFPSYFFPSPTSLALSMQDPERGHGGWC
jgi:hypothetical protein